MAHVAKKANLKANLKADTEAGDASGPSPEQLSVLAWLGRETRGRSHVISVRPLAPSTLAFRSAPEWCPVRRAEPKPLSRPILQDVSSAKDAADLDSTGAPETGASETDESHAGSSETDTSETDTSETDTSDRELVSRLWVFCEASYSPDPLLIAEPIAERLRQLHLRQFQDAVITIQV